jgi:hypothetical protein
MIQSPGKVRHLNVVLTLQHDADDVGLATNTVFSYRVTGVWYVMTFLACFAQSISVGSQQAGDMLQRSIVFSEGTDKYVQELWSSRHFEPTLTRPS